MHHGMGGTACPMCGCGMGHHGMKGMMGMKWMMMPWKLMMIADELGLSDDQKNNIREIITNTRKTKVQLRSQIEMDKIDLQNMVMQEQVNMQAVEQKVRDKANRKADMKIAMIQATQDIKNTLTPEQRDMMKQMAKSWMKGGMPGEESMEVEEGEESESEEQ